MTAAAPPTRGEREGVWVPAAFRTLRPTHRLRRRGMGALLRAALHRVLWAPLLWLCAGRLRILGRAPGCPVVFVADHASHVDTLAIRAALGTRGRRRLAVAAADDYFFATPWRGWLASIAVGAFAFPRHGDAGLRRADALLRRGFSVLLFPQGTRDPQAEYRPGVLRLAAAGWPIVPVGLAGTHDVLPKGARRPRRHRVAVVFGPALRAAEIAGDLAALRGAVADESRRARARLHEPAPPGGAGAGLTTASQWLRRRASSRTAPFLLLAWAFAEALVWPIIPDASLGILALAWPRRWLTLTAATTAGSVAGGLAGWSATVQGWAWPLPLTTPRMHDAAAGWLAQGAAGIAQQPLSGVPYKVFVTAAAPAGIGPGELALATAQFRGLRFAATAAFAAAVGAVLWHWLPRRLQPGVHVALSVAAVVVLLAGLTMVVRAWS